MSLYHFQVELQCSQEFKTPLDHFASSKHYQLGAFQAHGNPHPHI